MMCRPPTRETAHRVCTKFVVVASDNAQRIEGRDAKSIVIALAFVLEREEQQG
jgi:uncharacterized protein YaiL (DUF2058 family)